MEDSKCKKIYPKEISQETQPNVRGYPLYRRRGQERAVKKGQHRLDDTWVVPHNRHLLLRFESHINVEVCSSVKSVKYILKYIHKGQDMAHVEISEVNQQQQQGDIHHNEICQYLNARYLGPHEAVHRILKFSMHEKSHTIQHVQVHLPLQNRVYFRAGYEQIVQNINPNTTLTAWFTLNQQDPTARDYLYQEIPEHYTYNQKTRTWHKRQKRPKPTIGRIYQANPRYEENYALRLLLLNRRGATSFEDIRTINNELHDTFKRAALAMGLLEDDLEHRCCMDESTLFNMPSQMRQLFATLMIFQPPSDLRALFNEFVHAMSEDFVQRDQQTLRQSHLQTSTCASAFSTLIMLCGFTASPLTTTLICHNYLQIFSYQNMMDLQGQEKPSSTTPWCTTDSPWDTELSAWHGQDPTYQEFSEWLLRIGNHTEPHGENEIITLPDRICVNSSQQMINSIYPHPTSAEANLMLNTITMSERCCLTPKNENSHEINKLILQRLRTPTHTYFSADKVLTDDRQEAHTYPVEFLNAQTPSGMPLHKLELKVGAIIILLRNLNPKKGVCNGTQLIVRHLKQHVLNADIMTSAHRGQQVMIPKITMSCSKSTLPFTFSPKQFPVRLAYCLTINKAQGQSLKYVGIYLPQPVFSHGQLYVAMSRAKSFDGIKVFIPDSKKTKNVVYPEVL
eukprot:gene2726-biopygen2250